MKNQYLGYCGKAIGMDGVTLEVLKYGGGAMDYFGESFQGD